MKTKVRAAVGDIKPPHDHNYALSRYTGPALNYSREYRFSVNVTFRGLYGQLETGWSPEVPFVTQPTRATLANSSPFWDRNRAAQFVLFRRTLPPLSGQGYLYITAKPQPAYNLPHGILSSHLLCGYKLWVNGVPLGAGPGRMVGGAINVDAYNITSLVGTSGATLAVEAYYRQNPSLGEADRDADDQGGLMVHLHDGLGHILADGTEGWHRSVFVECIFLYPLYRVLYRGCTSTGDFSSGLMFLSPTSASTQLLPFGPQAFPMVRDLQRAAMGPVQTITISLWRT